MTLVDLFASTDHYAEHLWPIWQQLHEGKRGHAWSTSRSSWWGPRAPRHQLRASDRLTLVAGWQDAKRVDGPVVYVEHGAGQQYRDLPGHPSYSGGHHRGSNVVGYVCPNETVAARWRAARPDLVGDFATAVGSPKLDRWLPDPPPPIEPRTIAITAHWNCRLNPETRPALPHYTARGALARVIAGWRAAGWHVLGHGHPRARVAARQLWHEHGVPFEPSAAAVLERAAVLVADNTSLLYEAAALDRPVVVLNAPWYRRDVEHGLRFWSLVPGQQVDDADELAALDLASYVDVDPTRQLRRDVVSHVYAALDGNSAARAADLVARLAVGG